MSSYVRPVPKHLAGDPAIGVAHDFYIGGHGLLVKYMHASFEVTEWMRDYYCEDQNRNSALTVVELF